jgi:hypothetical protein
MEMVSPPVKPIAPSTHPALELIALAQLSPEDAGQRLRALLLANPHYFGNVPPTSFHAVLKIQEDTTYECISAVAYDAQFEQLRAIINIKQAVGYSGLARANGSEEFVRFYVSYDGGAKWLDQGMRSVNVSDDTVSRPLSYDVVLQIVPSGKPGNSKPRPRIRAILSWNSPPPAGAPDWTPVWGNVLESDMQINSRVSFPIGSQTTTRTEQRQSIAGRERQISALPSSESDPSHRFLTYMFARAARHTLLGTPNPAVKAMNPKETIAPRSRAVAIPTFQIDGPPPNADGVPQRLGSVCGPHRRSARNACRHKHPQLCSIREQHAANTARSISARFADTNEPQTPQGPRGRLHHLFL